MDKSNELIVKPFFQYRAQSVALHQESRGSSNGEVEDTLEGALSHEHSENEIIKDDGDDEEFFLYKFINNEINKDNADRRWCILI